MNLPPKIGKMLDELQAVTRGADRAAGAQAQLLKRIKEEYGCPTLEEAEKLLEKKEKELARMEEEFTRDYAKFQEKWSPYLEGDADE